MSKVSPAFKECEICVEKRICVICPYCQYSACSTCYEKVILSSVNKPSCVSCKKEFNDDFFHAKFSDSFIKKKYKNHRENVLFEYEESLLPETQVHVERIYKVEELKKDMLDIEIQISELRVKQAQIREKMWRVQHGNGDVNNGDEKKEEKESFVGPCPVNECRGYLSTRYKCGICGVKACPECREVKNDEHKCDPNTVETVKELKKSCRQCPNCMTTIYRISGCDQMWCTKCKTAFNWVTGKIEKGMIHNPHFFQWMSENGGAVPRNPMDVQCGGIDLARLNMLRNFHYPIEEPFDRWDVKWKHYDQYIMEIYRELVHHRHVTLHALPTPLDNVTNQDLRIDFLMKKITKDEFKVKLQRREKDRNKKLEYRQIIEMYTAVLEENLIKLVRDIPATLKDSYSKMSEAYKAFCEEEKRVREYANKSIEKLKKKYSSTGLAMIF